MSVVTFPSLPTRYRFADLVVHIVGLCLILVAGSALVRKAFSELDTSLVLAVIVYVAAALGSNLASFAYHFSKRHSLRPKLRRIDHAAIYPSIAGTFTPFFVQAGTTWTMTMLAVCWTVTAIAMWKKITDEQVKSRWSTASYFGLGAIGLLAIPDLKDVPTTTLWAIFAGCASYAIGTIFYARKDMPYRYATWHMWVNFGGISMFVGIWLALFSVV